MRNEIIQLIKDILPEYDNVLCGGHGREHVKDVITKSYNIAIELEQDPEVCCVAALLHDIGLLTHTREFHHIGSSLYILKHISILEKYFNDEQIYTIFKAVMEHRSGYKGKYFSLVSKIVADADRSSNIKTMIIRSYAYNKSKINDKKELQNVVYNYLKEKYYDKEYDFVSKQLQDDMNNAKFILSDRKMFNKYYDTIINNAY